jgi:hypothetical protein
MSERTKAQRRLIRVMEKRGGKGFLILRSAETGIRTYRRMTMRPFRH